MKKELLTLLIFTYSLITSAGVVDTLKVHSDVMNRDIPVVVVRPSSTVAQSPAKGKKSKKTTMPEVVKCPVVYLLHGAYANEYKWLEVKPTLPAIADEMQMIFVTPYVLNSWYFDSPVNKEFMYETFITKELIPWIDNHFPTLADRNHRAVTGLSMGGHGALFLSSRHIDLFGAAASMSGGVDIRLFPLNWNIPDMLGEMASNRQSWDEHSVMECVKNLKNGDVTITFDCGESDFFIEVNRALHARLLSLGIDHDFTTRPGGHTDQYWSNSLDYQLLFFKKYFNK
ncbi:MAG: esterase family protein [Bacteroidaceae bacterium]|nr:esterase family protein [Bacteroidaceae bacterium]